MARRNRFHLICTECRRCGATVWTGSRPLVATAAMKARYGAICEKCFTPEDYAAMDADYRRLFVNRAGA